MDIVSRAGRKTQLRGVSLRMSPTDRHRGKRSKQQKKMQRSCGTQMKATEQGRAAESSAQGVTTRRRSCRVLSSDEGTQMKATEQGRAAGSSAQGVTTRRPSCRVLSSDSSGSEAV